MRSSLLLSLLFLLPSCAGNKHNFMYKDKVTFKDPFYGECIGVVLSKVNDDYYEVWSKCNKADFEMYLVIPSSQLKGNSK